MNFPVLKRAYVSIAMALCLMLTGMTMQSAHAADTGSITGKVFSKADGGSQVPVQSGYVYLYFRNGNGHYDIVDSDPSSPLTDGFSFTGSTLTLNNLKAGSYKFEVAGIQAVDGGSYQREYYNDANGLDDATAITVGTTNVNIADMVIEPSAQITGRITDRAGKPLQGASVSFSRTEFGGGQGVQTNANGEYTSADVFGDGLVRGSYIVSASQSSFTDPDAPYYEQRYWQDAATYAAATPVAVTPAKTTSAIDIKLYVAPRIKLTVKDPAGNPIPNAPVGIWEFHDGVWGPAQYGPNDTDAAGVFRKDVRIGARYKFVITPPSGVAGVTEWYNNKYSEAAATEVSATSYDQLLNLEIQLGDAPAVTGTTPTISGTAQVGQTLTATPGTWGPTGVALAYQWLADNSPITNATGTTYKPTVTDIGKKITVRITGTLKDHTTKTLTSTATGAVIAIPVTGTTPTISGTAQVGQTLTATPGTWGPTGVALAYQWLADNSPITNATSTTYKTTVTDIGKKITVRITGTLDDHTTKTLTSTATGAVTAESVVGATPRISGTARSGSTLTATPGTWGPTGVTLTYKWFANGVAIPRATARTVKLSSTQAGKRITVEVQGTKAGATTLAKRSAATPVVVGVLSTKRVTISGKAKVGKKLSARTSLWAAKPVKVTYQWYRNGKRISGQTKQTYKLRKADKGKRITVRVTQRKTSYLTASKTSSRTSKVK